MTDGDDVAARIRRYVEHHPNADVMDVLGALILSPEHRGLVKDILEGERTGYDSTEAAFTAPKRGVWASELLNREQWMGHVEKRPFAPWADRDHPEADGDEDARWKWGITDNYVDGDTIAIAEDDPRLDGRVFLQQDDDPYVFVDATMFDARTLARYTLRSRRSSTDWETPTPTSRRQELASTRTIGASFPRSLPR